MMNFRVSSKIKELTPYKAGQSEADVKRRYKREFFVKLASNESPLGTSEKVREAIEKASGSLNLYPDPLCRELRDVAGAYYEVPSERILVGNGSNELIDLIIKVFCEPGEKVLTSVGAFIAYKICAQANRAELEEIPLKKNFSIDLEKTSNFLREKWGTSDFPKVLFIPNPNNPIGSYIFKNEVKDFLEEWGGREELLIVFDEAYTEFVEASNFPELKEELKYENVIVLKTMSKAFGLAGARLGFALGSPEVLGLINRVRNPFNVNNFAQTAGVAAFRDVETLERVKRLVIEERAKFSQFLEEQGINYVPSQANFLFFDTKKNALDVHESFLSEGLISRPLIPYGFKTHLRITMGSAEQMEFAKSVFKKVL